MVQFDDAQQNKRIKNIRAEEEELFIQKMSKNFGLKYIDLTTVSIETDALKIVPKDEATSSLLAPFRIVEKDLHIAMKSPNYPPTKEILEKLGETYTIIKYLTSKQSLERAWTHYEDISLAKRTKSGLLEISEEGLEKYAKALKTNNDIKNQINILVGKEGEHRVTELMQTAFGGAIGTDASDIHFEPQEDKIRMRLRQDGILQDISFIDKKTYKQILTRTKILSKMKITRTTNAQDGRFTIKYKGVPVEVRVSVIPSAYGESIVMRILNPKNINVSIEDLGMSEKVHKTLMREIKKPTGLILNTGPTGSGKTTTLYAFLKKVYTPDKKILTIEDPIEYHLTGISQTQVNHEKGYDFLHGLRAAMRQDPDIIMVGEIRDTETARVAVNAALTGHLVLSTLHTNNAAGVIPRLLDLGVSPHILAAALTASIAQRLVRKICTTCKKEIKPTPEQESLIREILSGAEKNNKNLSLYGISSDQEIKLWKGGGCDDCNKTGYRGRIGVFEVILTNDEIEELLAKNPTEQEIRQISEKQGLLNLEEDGIIKILKGETTLEEVSRVVGFNTKKISLPDTEEVGLQEKPTEIIPEESNIDNLIKTHEQKIKSPGKNYSPGSVLGTKGVEVALLVDYLKKLEDEQSINPDIGAGEKIATTQSLILELLKTNDLTKVFKQTEGVKIQTEISSIMSELKELEKEQKENPTQDVAGRLKRIRHEIESL